MPLNGLSGRLIKTGAPTLLASGLIYLQPILGRSHLSSAGYSTWALGATVLSMGLILDFGGTAYSVAASAAGTLAQSTLVRATALSVAGSALVGLIAVVVWPSYQAAHHLALPGAVGVLFFGCVTLAACLRSVTTIGMGILMAQGQDTRRAALLLGQAILQSVLLFAGLQAGSIWALPASSVLASLAVLPAFVQLRALPRHPRPHWPNRLRLRSFAGIKVAFALLSLVITQADRWVVGSVVPPSRLAQYDVTSRFAGIPRLVVAGIVGVLVAEASSNAANAVRIRHIYTRSLLFCAGLAVASSIGATFLAILLGGPMPWKLYVTMLIAFSLHALVTVGLAMTTGLGRPVYDLIFVIPTVIVIVFVWTYAHATQSESLAEYGVSIGLLVWAPMFVVLCRGGLRPMGRHHRGTADRKTESMPKTTGESKGLRSELI